MSLDWIDGPVGKPGPKDRACPDCRGTGQDRALPIDRCIRCRGTWRLLRDADTHWSAGETIEQALGDNHLTRPPPGRRSRRGDKP